MASIFRQGFGFQRSLLSRQCRTMATARKQFYKNVDIVSAGNGIFEVTLDSKKVKTPNGAVLTVENEGLALAVAHEWQAQDEVVQLSSMHLTGLCNTCTDNPTRITKFELVDNILNFLDTDTVLYFAPEPESLLDLQISKWNPVIEWFSHRHDVKLIPSKNMSELPTIPKIDREKVRRQLLSYSFNAVQGFTFGVDALKSLILMSAIVEHKLSVEQAVQLARLETKFQIEKWGNVPWCHDLELHDTTSRTAAAQIFFQCHNASHLKRTKNIRNVF